MFGDIFKKKESKPIVAPLQLPAVIPIFKIFKQERLVSADGMGFNDRVVDVSGPDPRLVHEYFKEQWGVKK